MDSVNVVSCRIFISSVKNSLYKDKYRCFKFRNNQFYYYNGMMWIVGDDVILDKFTNNNWILLGKVNDEIDRIV